MKKLIRCRVQGRGKRPTAFVLDDLDGGTTGPQGLRHRQSAGGPSLGGEGNFETITPLQDGFRR